MQQKWNIRNILTVSKKYYTVADDLEVGAPSPFFFGGGGGQKLMKYC
jgi:hypothetical protein